MLQPQRNKVLVTVLPMPETTGGRIIDPGIRTKTVTGMNQDLGSESVIIRVPSESPIRRVKVEAVGPDAQVEVGRIYLANILSGQGFGDQLVLPDKAGESAFLAQWDD